MRPLCRIFLGILLTFGLILTSGCSDSWDFSGRGPSDPFPEDGATDQLEVMVLTWSCYHPSGVTCKVYFGTTKNPRLRAETYDQNTYNPGILDSNTTYYWRVLARNNEDKTSISPVWKFTTRSDWGSGDTTTHTIEVDLSIEVLTSDDHLADRTWQQGIHWVIESAPNTARRDGDLTAWDGGSNQTTISWSPSFNNDYNAYNKFTLWTSGSPIGTFSSHTGDQVPKCGLVRYSMTVTVDGIVRHDNTEMLNTQQTGVLTLSLRQ